MLISKVFNDYKLNMSVSTTAHKSKEEFQKVAPFLKYRKQTLDLSTLCQRIRQGHSFCHCFDDNDEDFGNSLKTQLNFRYTTMIPFDIDDSNVTMEDYINSLAHKPTIAYTTMSDGIKGYRFRLLYCLDFKVKGAEQYRKVFSLLQSETGIGELKDKCTASCNQAIYGNAKNDCRILSTGLIYHIPTKEVPHTKKQLGVITDNKKKKKEGVIICNDTLMNEFRVLPLRDFVSSHIQEFAPIEESELNYQNGYAVIGDEHIRLFRNWCICTTDTGKTIRKIRKWGDGEGRRRKLGITGLLIKKMRPNISAEHLLWNLAYEAVHYYENIDGVITKDFLIRVVESVIGKDIEEITIVSHDKRKFAIDKDYWALQGYNPKAAIGKVRGKINAEKIGNLYDASKTDAENISAMKLLGLEISMSTLKRWRKKNGISRSK